MRTHPLRRGLMGLVATAAIVIAAANAAAAVPSTGSVDDLDMVLDGQAAGPDISFTVPVSGTGPCSSDTTSAQLDVEFNGGSGVTEVTDVRLPYDFFQNAFLLGDYWYRTELSHETAAWASSAGSITGSAPVYDYQQDVPLTFDLYQIGPNGGPYDCTGGTQVCTTFVQLELEGTWTPTSPNSSKAPAGVAELTGGGTSLVAGACSAPWAGWLDEAPVAVNDLEVTFA